VQAPALRELAHGAPEPRSAGHTPIDQLRLKVMGAQAETAPTRARPAPAGRRSGCQSTSRSTGPY
jgi:hypothetical protein